MAWNNTTVATILLVPGLALITGPGEPARNLAAAESITVTEGSPSQIELVHEVVGRFVRAGLELPAVSVVFQDEETGCGGALGRYVAAGTGSGIDVCVGPDAPPRQQRYVVAHELAHAWISSTLDDEARREFLVLHGLDDWNDRDVRWRLRGAEWAADTIA